MAFEPSRLWVRSEEEEVRKEGREREGGREGMRREREMRMRSRVLLFGLV